MTTDKMLNPRISPGVVPQDLAGEWARRRAAEEPDQVVVFEAGDVEPLAPSGPWLHRASGMLYSKSTNPVDAVVAKVWQENRWMRLCLPRRGTPSTLAEWEEQVAARAAAAAEADEQRREGLRQRRRPVTWAMVHGVEEMTLAEAMAFLRHHEALIDVEQDGRLHIEVDPHCANVPGLPAEVGQNRLRLALSIVLACSATVARHVRQGEPLPDRPLDPHGEPLP